MRNVTPRATPGKLAVALLLVGIAAFAIGWFVITATPDPVVHGAQPPGAAGPRPAGIHAGDILKLVLIWGGVALVLAGLYRWYTRGESAELNEQETRRRFGDSLTDARTNQDPLVGMLPVSSREPRH